MKKIGLLFIGTLICILSECYATTRYIPIYHFLYWQAQDKTILSPGNDFKCLEANKLIKLFDTLSNHSFFLYKYYPNPWSGKNIEILKKYAKDNESNNMLTKAIYPYVNDKLINQGDSISLYCEDSDYIYEAGAFDVTGTIFVEDKIGNYTRPIDGGSEYIELKYEEVYIMLNNVSDEKIKDLPYVKGNKLFIGCEDDTKNRLYWNGRYNNTYNQVSKRYIDSYYGKPRHPENELSQYEGKEISIRFYISPNYLKKDYKSEIVCENIRMLDYDVK